MRCDRQDGRDRIFAIDPQNPDPALIRRAGEVIQNGGLAGFPTTRLYGIGADPFNPEAVEKVFAAKGRPAHMPVLLLLDEPEWVGRLAAEVSDTARRIMETVWPGGVTLVFRAAFRIDSRLTAGTGKIGLRLPAHPVARALAKSAGGPVTGTSANLSGKPDPACLDEMDPLLKDRLDIILDAGRLPGPPGSTVVDVTAVPPKILRRGATSGRAIETAAGVSIFDP